MIVKQSPPMPVIAGSLTHITAVAQMRGIDRIAALAQHLDRRQTRPLDARSRPWLCGRSRASGRENGNCAWTSRLFAGVRGRLVACKGDDWSAAARGAVRGTAPSRPVPRPLLLREILRCLAAIKHSIIARDEAQLRRTDAGISGSFAEQGHPLSSVAYDPAQAKLRRHKRCARTRRPVRGMPPSSCARQP